MDKRPNICCICLREDKKLAKINIHLVEFHMKLCDYTPSSMQQLYCISCEYLLRKTYNFKTKCMRALLMFEDWKMSKMNDSVLELSKQLPSSLAPLTANQYNIIVYSEHDEEISSVEPIHRTEANTENLFYITKLEIGCHTEMKDQIKIEDEMNPEILTYKNNNFVKDEHEITIDNNFLCNISENDTFVCENSYQTDADFSQIELACKKNELNLNQKVSNDNMKLNESNDGAYSMSGNDEYDSNDSQLPLSKSCKKKKKNISKKKTHLGKIKCKSKKSKPLAFSKESLQTELQKKFDLWGELRTEDGTVIDKQAILDCLHDKITDERMKQLWDCIQCETPNPVTLRTFKHLMRNFTNEEIYLRVFNIEYFNTEEKMREEMLRRTSYQIYINAKYKCQICHLVFYKPKHLEKHVKTHEESAGEFLCEICSVRFTAKKNLRQHLASHGTVYRCKLCPLVTYYRDSMVNHYNQHEGKYYKCESCDKICKSLSGYKRHQYLLHRRGRHVCTTCGRAFVSDLGLAFHKKKMHQNAPPPAEESRRVQCTECELSFPSEQVLAKHRRTTHDEPKPKNARRKRPENYKKPSITCRLCGQAGSIGWLSLHFRTEHPAHDLDDVYKDKRKHLCHICAKAFWHAATLRNHLNAHSGARPYACALCPKKFHSSAALIEHRLHHFPPAKECAQCGKKFRTLSNLHNHMLFHSNSRRHKCNICGKAFIHSWSLKEHISGVHYNLRRVKKGERRAETAATAGEGTE